MVAVREISKDEQLYEDADYIIIEPTAAGRFTANGSVTHRDGANFFTPPPFATLEIAIAISRDWAKANKVHAVYVRTG